MKLKNLILPVLFVSLFTWGCGEESSTPASGSTDSTVVNTPPEDISMEMPSDPVAFEDGEFGMRGMDYFSIGDTIAQLMFDMEGVAVKDTAFKDLILGENGMEEVFWEVKKVLFEDGAVFLESDFDQGTTLNRIRVETPRYRHFHTNIGVGSTVKEALAAYPGMAIRPFKDYNVIELIPNNQNIFHIPYQELANPDDLEAWKIDLLPENAEIFRIVIM
jgi:hypothetical protein